MKFEKLWHRDIHNAVNPSSFAVTDDGVYITERSNKLSKIAPDTGKAVWTQNVPNTHGWVKVVEGLVFYMSQGEGLYTFRVDDGEPLPHQRFEFGYLGYVEVCGNIILTGGWRGYTDLSAYDRATRTKLWSQPVKSKDLQEFSVPCFLNNVDILTVNFSTGLISIIDANSGKVRNSVGVPLGVRSSDSWRYYRLINGAVAFLTRAGTLLLLNPETLEFSEERLNMTRLMANTPCYLGDKVVFRESQHRFTLYDRKKRCRLWDTPIDYNDWAEVPAQQLGADITLIAGSYGAMKAVRIDGEVVHSFPTEKRITTPIHRLDGRVFYGSKGAIHSLAFEL